MEQHSLKNLAPNLWVVDSTFHVMCVKGSTRMTIVRLKSGDLWIHSPINMSDGLRNTINSLGRVAYVVAPNNMHYLYFRQCLDMFPGAQGYVAQSLVEKHASYGEYPRIEALRKAIKLEIDQIEFKGHTLGETVFFHKPSRTMIVADLLYNLQPENLWFEKMVMRLFGAYGKPSIPLYHKVAIKDRRELRASIDRVAGWPIRRIVMAHGEIVVGRDAGNVFLAAWGRIIPDKSQTEPQE